MTLLACLGEYEGMERKEKNSKKQKKKILCILSFEILIGGKGK